VQVDAADDRHVFQYTFVAHACPLEVSIEQRLSASELHAATRMLMRFNIEQRHLTDAGGRPVSSAAAAVSFHSIEAESASDAVRVFVEQNGGQLIGEVKKFPGFHAVATVRNTEGVYTLQVAPSSQRFAPV
jgi:hypothetical protein